MSYEDRRIVITGLGVVGPFGLGIGPLKEGLLAGGNALRPIKKFDLSLYNIKSEVAGEVPEFDIKPFFHRERATAFEPFAQYAKVAAELAREDAGLSLEDISDKDVLLPMGGGYGALSLTQNVLLNMFEGTKVRPGDAAARILANMSSVAIARDWGTHGWGSNINSACASGIDAIIEAFVHMKAGDADIAFPGGTDSLQDHLGYAPFETLRALSSTGESKPLDQYRNGFVPAEGAGVLALEELGHAQARGARIYAEIIGYGQSMDGEVENAQGKRLSLPSGVPKWQAYAAKKAIAMAGIKPEDVTIANLHATATPTGDIGEYIAYREVFGDHLDDMIVYAPKAFHGHHLGAAGSIEAAELVFSLYDGIIPGHPDLVMDKDIHFTVLDAPTIDKSHVVGITTAFGFGGKNSALILRKYEEPTRSDAA